MRRELCREAHFWRQNSVDGAAWLRIERWVVREGVSASQLRGGGSRCLEAGALVLVARPSCSQVKARRALALLSGATVEKEAAAAVGAVWSRS